MCYCTYTVIDIPGFYMVLYLLFQGFSLPWIKPVNSTEVPHPCLIRPGSGWVVTHICITLPQWVNQFWLGKDMCCQITWSMLARVMACCLMAPSYYLTQWLCYVVVILKETPQPLITEINLKEVFYSNFNSHLPGTKTFLALAQNCHKYIFLYNMIHNMVQSPPYRQLIARKAYLQYISNGDLPLLH